MSRILIFILRAYQTFLSPLMPGGCKFYPSCSHYAVEAVETHGALRGAWLAALRVLRCRPLARGGYDPVPAAPLTTHRVILRLPDQGSRRISTAMKSGIEILRASWPDALRMTKRQESAR